MIASSESTDVIALVGRVRERAEADDRSVSSWIRRAVEHELGPPGAGKSKVLGRYPGLDPSRQASQRRDTAGMVVHSQPEKRGSSWHRQDMRTA